MENQFNVPQRQSAVGIIVMFFDTVQQYARALWPIFVVWIFKFNEINKLWLLVGGLLFFAAIGVVAYLRYRNFTFFLDQANGEFVITEGVFSKTRTTIALHKIQQVNIKQSLLQRIIGIHALDVDTAGSKEKEVSIKAISHALAIALKAKLLENERTFVGQDALVENAVSEEKPFISISLLSLLKVGITSNYIRSLGLLLAFFATLYDNILRFSNQGYLDEDQFSSYFDRNAILSSIGIVLLIMFGSILVINIFRIVVRYFDYKIAKQKGSLLLSFGLFNTKSTIIKPEKVQIVAITRNYFQKKLDVLELKIKQATGGEQEERKQAIEIPGCNESERDAILKLLFGKIPEKGVMLRPNFRKLVFSIFLTIVLPLALFYLIAVNAAGNLLQFAYLIPVYIGFALLILCFGFKNYRLFIGDRFIIKQSGAWDITDEIIEPQKIQALTVSQLFWHKSADIGYLTIHTAGGNVSFQLGDFTTIKQYVNLWLYEMETSDSNWM
ncbi:PH domain-containing protein [Flavobacterium sp.]|uniref:PH domain-containing protein n=1 Tax=Flavobacterium sp. TaxID=239 RepID=UPI0039E3EF44